MSDSVSETHTPETLRHLYTTMVRIRVFEEKLAELLEVDPKDREVRCPCHLYIGQEAIATGVCAALEAADTVWGGHRSHGHYIAKGGSLDGMMAEIFGKETGCSRGRGGSMHLFAPEVGILGTVPLVAATIPISVGAALASKIRGEKHVAVAFFGDGAVEEGHFHESVNMAAVYDLPVIFVVENNFYSSHLPLLDRRREDNIVKTADAHGIPGVSMDGNDVLEVLRHSTEAVERGRSGGGPTLFECRTYRWRGHVGPSWDMDVGVKRKNELDEWLPKDPIARLRTHMTEAGESESSFDEIQKSVEAEVDESIAFARRSEFPSAAELYEHLYTVPVGGATPGGGAGGSGGRGAREGGF